MPQYEVKIFQQARINTETFTVEADGPEQAQTVVRNEHLEGKDLVSQGGQYEVEIREVPAEEPLIGQPALVSEPPAEQVQ